MKGWAHGIQGRGEEQGLGVGGQGELSLLAAPTVSRSWNTLSIYKIPPVSSHQHSEVTFWCSRLPKSASLPSKLSSFHFHLGTLSPRAMLMPTLSSGPASLSCYPIPSLARGWGVWCKEHRCRGPRPVLCSGSVAMGRFPNLTLSACFFICHVEIVTPISQSVYEAFTKYVQAQ